MPPWLAAGVLRRLALAALAAFLAAGLAENASGWDFPQADEVAMIQLARARQRDESAEAESQPGTTTSNGPGFVEDQSKAMCNADSLPAFLTQKGHPVFEPGTNDHEWAEMSRLAQDLVSKGGTRICETGFNSGISSLVWLCTSDKITVRSFDIGEHPYTVDAQAFLQQTFGANRLSLTFGDSTSTLPGIVKEGQVCDMAFVDGGHTTEIATADILNFAKLTVPGGRLLVENCNVRNEAKGFGGLAEVNRAYTEMLKTGIIEHLEQVSTPGCQSADLTTCREICVARYKASTTAAPTTAAPTTAPPR